MQSSLTYNWSEYNHDYEKRLQDIRLKDGTEIMECYPNAGKWVAINFNGFLEFPDETVTHTRLSDNLEYNDPNETA